MSSTMRRTRHSTYAGVFCNTGADVTPVIKGSPLSAPSRLDERDMNLRATSTCACARTCSTATWLSDTYFSSRLPLRTAAMISGGRNDACDTQVTVDAQSFSPQREVMTYIPLDSIRNACL